jgi:hypothetical protein
MDATQEKTQTNVSKKTPSEFDPTKIDRNAPAGSENSLAAESVRDARPSTDDDVVEAIDEEGPGVTEQPRRCKSQNGCISQDLILRVNCWLHPLNWL